MSAAGGKTEGGQHLPRATRFIDGVPGKVEPVPFRITDR
jgi:hypothetical protein